MNNAQTTLIKMGRQIQNARKGSQVEKLRREIETLAGPALQALTVEITAKNLCCICGAHARVRLGKKDLEASQDLLQTAAILLNKTGFREGSSKKFGVTGFMCPTCKKTPDHKREA